MNSKKRVYVLSSLGVLPSGEDGFVYLTNAGTWKRDQEDRTLPVDVRFFERKTEANRYCKLYKTFKVSVCETAQRDTDNG